MAAGTQGFEDTRGSVNYYGNLVSKILLARQLAENERQKAEKIAEAQGTSLEEAGIGRGFFFRKALQYEFGGKYIDKKKEQYNKLKATLKTVGKSPRKSFFKLFKVKVSSYKQNKFSSKFDYPTKEKATTRSKSSKVPSTAKKIQKATTGSKRVSREQLLSTFTELVDSLNKTAESLNANMSLTTSGIIKSSVAQANLADQLKVRNNTLDDKLDRLIDAISNQTQVQKKNIQKEKFKSSEAKLESAKDVAATSAFDKLYTPENETEVKQTIEPVTSITNIQNIAATASQRAEMQQMEAYNPPQFERGGIVSGPDSGYLVKLHGNEMVIPLDNNYTQGQPSAIDGKVRPRPIQKYEMGTRSSAVGGKFGFNLTNTMGIANMGTAPMSAMTQPLVDAMSLPMIATGGTLLAATTQLMRSMGSEGQNINPEIEKISRPISDVFGLPSTITKAAKAKTPQTKGVVGEEESVAGDSKKNMLAKLIDGFGSLLEKLGDDINKNKPNDKPTPTSGQLLPGDAAPEIKALIKTISGGEGGPTSVQGIGAVKGLSEMTIDDAISKAKSFIGKGSETGALGAFQFHSSYLRERAIQAGLDPTKDKFSMENQTKIMRNFMTSVWTAGGGKGGEAGLLKALQSGQLEGSVFPKLAKDLGWPSLPGGSQPNVHTPEAAKRYQANLKKYQQASLASKPTQPTVKDLGQAISNNYGLNIGEERSFTHPQYGLIKAHKTATGFDFYQGFNKLDMSPSKPQSKTIVNYFESTNGGRPVLNPSKQDAKAFNPPQKPSIDQQLSSNVNTKGSSPTIISMGLPQGNQKNGTTPMPTTKDSTLLPGYAPQLRDYYPTNTIT